LIEHEKKGVVKIWTLPDLARLAGMKGRRYLYVIWIPKTEANNATKV
jgi:hypothetical protein